MFKSLAIVGFGGLIGTVIRFLIARYFQLNFPSVDKTNVLLFKSGTQRMF
jgi:fluoride ion exporter CrcB/FEX